MLSDEAARGLYQFHWRFTPQLLILRSFMKDFSCFFRSRNSAALHKWPSPALLSTTCYHVSLCYQMALVLGMADLETTNKSLMIKDAFSPSPLPEPVLNPSLSEDEMGSLEIHLWICMYVGYHRYHQ